MELGRNISYDEQTNRYYLVVRYNFEKQLRHWNFDTHRKAMRKFNQLKKQGATWFNISEDVTI